MGPEKRKKILLEAPPESWIAFSEDEDRVVAQGSTYEEVVAKSKENGELEPILTRTPKGWGSFILAH